MMAYSFYAVACCIGDIGDIGSASATASLLLVIGSLYSGIAGS